MVAGFEQVTVWLREFAGPFVQVLLPIGILVVGWIAALIISALVRAILKKTQLDNRLVRIVVGGRPDAQVPAEKWIARGIFYVLMLFVLVAFFEATGLEMVTQPLNNILQQIVGYLPVLLSAGLLMLIAWGLAGLARSVIIRVLTAARVDERLNEEAGLEEGDRVTIPQNVGYAAYWLVFLVFLPAVLSTLGLTGLLEPIQSMTGDLIGFVPNVFAALLILIVGWFAARIVQRIVSNLLAAAGLDSGARKAGLDSMLGDQHASQLIGRLVHALIMLLTIVSALDALQFRAISAPATHMLSIFLDALPSLFLAGAIMFVAYLVGKFVRNLVSDLLAGAGFNLILVRLGIAKEPTGEDRTPSQIVGYLVFLVVLLFASIESADALGFGELADLLAQFTSFAGQIVMGLLILGIGIFLANLAGGMIRARGGSQGALASVVVRSAILVLVGAMALREMGLAEDIINLAFGLLMGSVAVAAAIAFGLGAREAAAEQVRTWLDSCRNGSSSDDSR